MNWPQPYEQTTLYGHDAALTRFAQEAHRLAGGYLITGAKGIGKASVAYYVARWLLAGMPVAPTAGVNLFGEPEQAYAPLYVDPSHAASVQVAARTHPDLLVLEPAIDEKKKTQKDIITVEDVRRVGGLLSQSSAAGGYRIVLIDAAEQMNANAANAVLKWLEEPPERAVFFLISHMPGRLLPTIRSRCRTIALSPPASTEASQLLQSMLPDLAVPDAFLLLAYAAYAPGMALWLHEHKALDYHTLLEKGEGAAIADAFAKAPVMLHQVMLTHYLLAQAKKASSAELQDRINMLYQRVMLHLKEASTLNLDMQEVLFGIFQQVHSVTIRNKV